MTTQNLRMYNKNLVFWAACLGILLFGISLITLGSIIPDLKEKLDLSEIESGTLFSILPFGILTGSLLFGPVVDKFGYRILLSLSCLLLFAGFEGVAYSSSQGILKIYIFFVGLGGGAVNGATNALVSDISDKDKAANLSLLGVSFGIGALGMPLVLGLLRSKYSFETILAAVGILTLATAFLFLVLRLPPPKQAQGFPLRRSISLIRDKVLILIAFYLFFQSSFEGILNNWTTSFLINQMSVPKSSALYGLSLFVAGMVVMRLLLGSLFRSATTIKIMITSYALIFIGLILLKAGVSFHIAVAGLFLLGAGLAGGFPVMLGLVGERFSDLSGTAFSIVMAVGLLGNMLINYGMGIIAQNHGIGHLITVASAELVIMIVLFFIILNKSGKSIK